MEFVIDCVSVPTKKHSLEGFASVSRRENGAGYDVTRGKERGERARNTDEGEITDRSEAKLEERGEIGAESH